MSLPILSHHPQPTVDDLVRFYHRTELHWCGQVAEETNLDVGTALTNPQLQGVLDANHILDGNIPEGMTPTDAVAQADEHFRAQGVRCTGWTLAPALPQQRTAPLAEHLLAAGWKRNAYDIMYLKGQPRGVIEEVAGLTIIPARASFRHARAIVEDANSMWTESKMADACMLHLEDPHTDALIALKDGNAVAMTAVLTVGEIGCIELLHVSERCRRQGIGRTMMSRAMEICARSLFKHVFVGCDASEPPALALYTRCGFQKVGEYLSYRSSLAS